jgi:CRP-like cAMP-binding protein
LTLATLICIPTVPAIKKIEHDTDATATRGTFRALNFPGGGTSGLVGGDSLTKIQAKSLMRYSGLLNAGSGECQTFRLARIGPGWVTGTIEAVSGMQRPGDTIAVDHCRLHHLPFSKIKEVEKTNPALILHLYKLLSYLMARRQEATIGQLATLHSIMTAPAKYGSLRRASSRS